MPSDTHNHIEPRIRGDMQGDKIVIEPRHVAVAKEVFARLPAQPDKLVMAVSGPSGSGKSEVASLLGSAYLDGGFGAYVLSCDNYPHRPPRDNESHREALFAEGGEAALREYLGTEREIDFERLAHIVSRFKAGAPAIPLRIMDNPGNRVADEARETAFADIAVLVLEGTWSGLINGVDLRVFLDTDFEQTLAHRKLRARDPLSEFGELVLRVEQARLQQVGQKAEILMRPNEPSGPVRA